MPMAFLSTLLMGSEQSYPPSLREHLGGFALFEGLGDAAVRKLLSDSCWFGLPGGMTLARDGENHSALFLVVTGCVGIYVDEPQRGRRLVAQVPAGETVGEMSLLTGDEHIARIVALRDTELLRIGHEGFEALISRHPRLALNMMRFMVRRLRDTTRNSRERARPRTFAIVPLQEGLGDEPIVHRLAAALVSMGSRASVLDASVCDQTAEWFDAFEAAHDVVFYRGDAPNTAWSHLCERQADRVLFLARADRPLPLQPVRSTKERVAGPPDLLLLHPGSVSSGLPENFMAHSGLFETHHHIRASRTEDILRLARYVSGRAVGLVLGGGGARGFAHIGVAKALTEAKVPFDFLGGVSMGAIIAAGLAAEWSIEEMTERLRDVFVVRKPLSDYTVPLIALVRGKKVSTLLQAHFGDMRIEELPKPYFCVSSDLTTGRIHEHRTGLIWRTLRASVALPGILPPVSHRGHLLVDGGVMNNLPVDVMRERRIGPLIASDVTGEVDMSVRDSRYGERPIWRLLWQRMRGTPSIVSILMRSGTVGSEAQRRIVREQADYLFEPPMPDVGVRDWRLFDRAVAEGYAHACVQIEKHGVPLTAAWSEGPAVAVPPDHAAVAKAVEPVPQTQ
ncbi:MAG: patatin-like phospholipase family protein [Alphaproteobacteria bacterium]|nr:patatin-like phospholipase family protein [Alphaproteobacteria bacterium]